MAAKPDDGNVLSPLVEELLRHRRLLIGAYLVLLAVFVGLFWYGGVFAFPEVFAKVIGIHNVFGPEEERYPIANALVITGFFFLQFLFLWGGGRIRLSSEPVRLRRLVVSIFMVAVWMSLLTAGLVFSVAEMLNRFSNDPVHPGGGVENLLSDSMFITMLGASWLLWMLIGIALTRGVNQHNALSRLISVVLAGSWIEFTVALPIDLVTRERNKDCVCASGSWAALLVCIPILVWSIGPAIYLLYRRERGLTQIDHRRPLRVLLSKSARKAAPLGQ